MTTDDTDKAGFLSRLDASLDPPGPIIVEEVVSDRDLSTTRRRGALMLGFAIVACLGGPAACAGARLSSADRGRIEAAANQREPEYLACYEEALVSDPSLKGKVVLSFDVKPSSTGALNPRVTSTDITSEALETCILSVTSRVVLGAFPSGPAAITYPLEFEREPVDPAPFLP